MTRSYYFTIFLLLITALLLPAGHAKTIYSSAISLDEIHSLKSNFKDPKEGPHWQNGEYLPAETIEIKSNDIVNYITHATQQQGDFRFLAALQSQSNSTTYTVIAGKTAHNILLRANLLRKLGYKIDEIKHISRLTVNFESFFEKESFKKQLAINSFATFERWLVEEEGNSLTLQDLIVTENNNPLNNFTDEKKRILNSKLIPYALTHLPESINLLSWEFGKVFNETLKAEYESSNELKPSLDDAKWMAYKIAQLTRVDFQEIVQDSFFPLEVEKLLVEKLIAKRNNLCKLLSLNIPDLYFDSEISLGQFLQDGRLLKKKWEGYATYFSSGAPSSPLPSSELLALFNSKLGSLSLDYLVGKINERLPHLDMEEEIEMQRSKLIEEAIARYKKTGEVQSTPINIVAKPHLGANLIASRNIVTGNYRASNNFIQLVDNIGVNIDLGAYFGTDSLPLPITLSGGISAHVTRTFSHIKPFESVDKAIQDPFRNLIVPLAQINLRSIFKKDNTQKALDTFKDQLRVGESLIITDSIGGGFEINTGRTLSELASAQLEFSSKQLVVSRMQIYRSDEDTLQIYKDLGHTAGMQISLGLNVAIPVLKITIGSQMGSAKTDYYRLNLGATATNDDEAAMVMQSIKGLLLKNSFELLDNYFPPFNLEHKFFGDDGRLNALFLRFDWQNTTDLITITHPSGAKQQYIKRIKGSKSKDDWGPFGIDSANWLVKKYTDLDFTLAKSEEDSVNADFLSSASARHVIFEGAVSNFNHKESSGKMKRPFIKISYFWRGWEKSNKALQKIINEINSKYDVALYPDTALHSTDKIQLYNIELDFHFYVPALIELCRQSRGKLRNVFYKYAKYHHQEDFNERSREEARDKMVQRYLYFTASYREAYQNGDLHKQAKYLSNLIDFLEKRLELNGILSVTGGKKNIFINSHITGFRKGAEDGRDSILSNTIGNVSAINYKGPLEAVRNKMKMTEAEFNITWLLKILK